MTLKCCKCGKKTRKFTQVCESCGHRFCKLCKGRNWRAKLGLSSAATYPIRLQAVVASGAYRISRRLRTELIRTYAVNVDIGNYFRAGRDFGAITKVWVLAQAAVASVLAVRCLGKKGFAGRSRFSRRIISVRKVVRTRLLISSDNRELPVPMRASFIAEAAT